VLVASVGGSLELVVNAVVLQQPDFVYFLCSTGKGGSDTLIEKIVPAAKLSEGAYAVERVQSPHDFPDVVAACGRIEADLGARFAGDELHVVANYTGGTRTMSAGLGALALRHGWLAEVTERPVRPWIGPISNVRISAVTVFADLELSCSEGLNVIIGENGTGKTHLLKRKEKWITLDEFCEHMNMNQDVGRKKLEKLLQDRSLERVSATGDRFAPGVRWEEFHEDPT
jgi:hypothetical protein